MVFVLRASLRTDGVRSEFVPHARASERVEIVAAAPADRIIRQSSSKIRGANTAPAAALLPRRRSWMQGACRSVRARENQPRPERRSANGRRALWRAGWGKTRVVRALAPQPLLAYFLRRSEVHMEI